MRVPYANQRGVSLIEILVVLVILMVGILSAIRVFPTGFGLIQHSADVTMASRLAQHEMASWTLDPASLPIGVLPNDCSGYPLPDRENFNLFRDVIGESTEVQGGDDPFYVVHMGPVDDPANISIRTEALAQEPFSMSGMSPSYEKLLQPIDNPQIKDIQRYQIDEDAVNASGHSAPQLYFRSTPFVSKILMEYQYITTSGARSQYHSSSSAPTELNGSNFPEDAALGSKPILRVPLELPADYAALVPGSVKVYRILQVGDITAANPFTYQMAGGKFSILHFNPQLQGIRVFINYRVADWKILHEDVKVEDDPTATSGNPRGLVRTAVPFLKDYESAEAIKNGGAFMPGMESNVIAVAVNLETGVVSNVESWTPRALYQKDLRGGVIRSDKLEPGSTVRIYYRCDGDWAMWLSKAYSLYDIQTATGPVCVGSCRLAGLNAVTGSTINEWEVRVEFPLCDAGNGAVADIQAFDAKGTLIANMPGTFLTISDVPEGDNAVGVGIIRLPDAVKSAPDLEISNVRGVSVKVRVAWKEGDRPKFREVTSVLNR